MKKTTTPLEMLEGGGNLFAPIDIGAPSFDDLSAEEALRIIEEMGEKLHEGTGMAITDNTIHPEYLPGPSYARQFDANPAPAVTTTQDSFPPMLPITQLQPASDRPPIIGITGLIGSGKDSLAMAFEQFGYRRTAFAAHLKDVTAKAYGWPRVLLEGDTDESREWREQPCPVHGITPRSALQKVGVAFRDIDPEFWVRACLSGITPDRPAVISDVRFPNEANAIRDAGGIILNIFRDIPEWRHDAIRMNDGKITVAEFQAKWGDVHVSETAMMGYKSDHVLYNMRNPDGWRAQLRNMAEVVLDAYAEQQEVDQ